MTVRNVIDRIDSSPEVNRLRQQVQKLTELVRQVIAPLMAPDPPLSSGIQDGVTVGHVRDHEEIHRLLQYGVLGAVRIQQGTGSPEGVLTADPGAVYLNLSGGAGTTLYVKETGNASTGWVGK